MPRSTRKTSLINNFWRCNRAVRESFDEQWQNVRQKDQLLAFLPDCTATSDKGSAITVWDCTTRPMLPPPYVRGCFCGQFVLWGIHLHFMQSQSIKDQPGSLPASTLLPLTSMTFLVAVTPSEPSWKSVNISICLWECKVHNRRQAERSSPSTIFFLLEGIRPPELRLLFGKLWQSLPENSPCTDPRRSIQILFVRQIRLSTDAENFVAWCSSRTCELGNTLFMNGEHEKKNFQRIKFQPAPKQLCHSHLVFFTCPAVQFTPVAKKNMPCFALGLLNAKETNIE